MLYTPTKVIYKPSDPFFNEGNIALRAYWLQRDAVDRHNAELIREEATRLAKQVEEEYIYIYIYGRLTRHVTQQRLRPDDCL